jgi:hypothetical protein
MKGIYVSGSKFCFDLYDILIKVAHTYGKSKLKPSLQFSIFFIHAVYLLHVWKKIIIGPFIAPEVDL